MKKTYIEPSVKAIEIKPIVLAAASTLDIDTEETVESGEEELIQSSDFGFSMGDE